MSWGLYGPHPRKSLVLTGGRMRVKIEKFLRQYYLKAVFQVCLRLIECSNYKHQSN